MNSHHGQHDSNCYGCKLQSLSISTGQPPKHKVKGDHWTNNPVKDRIEELQETGKKVSMMELTKEQ